MALADELVRLTSLHRAGALTDEEFAKAKAALISAPPDVSGRPPPLPRAALDDRDDADPSGARGREPDAVERETRQWAAYVHFALLAGLVVPLAGLLLPIVLWQTKRIELPGLDAHGRIVVNWTISCVIYLAAGTALAFVVVGIPILVAVGVLMIVFPVLGGVKAGQGVAWPYPLSIRFLR